MQYEWLIRTAQACFQALGSSTDKPLCRSRFLTKLGSKTLTVLSGRVGHPQMGMRGRASGQATSLSTEHPVTNSFTFSVIQHPPEVCPLARGANLEPLSGPLQTGLRLLRRPLPANPLASLAARCLCCQRGLPVYHVSYQHRYRWVRFRLFAGGATSATGDFIAPVPDPLPFGSSLSASLACCS